MLSALDLSGSACCSGKKNLISSFKKNPKEVVGVIKSTQIHNPFIIDFLSSQLSSLACEVIGSAGGLKVM